MRLRHLQTRTQTRHQSRPRRFFDILNWDTLAAPGVIRCKDGSYLAGWDVTGIDTETLEDVALEAWLDQLAFALSGLSDGEALRVVRNRSPREPAPTGWQAGPKGGALEALAIEQDAICATPGYLWADRVTLYYHWQPQPGQKSGQTGTEDLNITPGLDIFETQCQKIGDRLGGVLTLHRLGPKAVNDTQPSTGQSSGDVWHSCALTSSLLRLLGQPERRVRVGLDHLPFALDALIGVDVEQPDRYGPARICNRPVAILALEGFTAAVNTGALARVQSLGLAMTCVSQYAALSNQKMREIAREKQRLWRQSGADMVANVGGESQGKRGRFEDRMAEDIEDTLDRLSSGETGQGYYATHMMLVGAIDAPDESLNPALRTLTSAVEDAGLRLRRETVNFLPALLSILPGHEDRTARAFPIRANAFAGMLPLRAIWQGSELCPSPRLPAGTPALLRAQAQTGDLFHFNLHSADVGHSLIFGPTGAGKSVLLGLLAASWMRYPQARVIYFDRQRSIRHACAALGGVFLEPGGKGPAGIAPLAHIGALGQSWAVDWLTALVRLQRTEPDTVMLNELRAAVANCAGMGAPDMSNIASYVQIPELRTALEPFLPGGTWQDLFSEDRLFAGLEVNDATQDLFTQGSKARQSAAAFTVFETHPLMEGPEIARVLSLDYIFAQVQRRFDGRPTLVVFDEAWSFFKHPLFIERIRSWLKEGRKNNVAVVMATQSLADAIRSELTAELLESCPTKIFLPNAGAEGQVIADQYTALGLHQPEISQIARMRPKRDYFLTQLEGRRVISFPLGHIGLSILGKTGSDDSRRAGINAANKDFWKEDIEDAYRKMENRNTHDRWSDQSTTD